MKLKPGVVVLIAAILIVGLSGIGAADGLGKYKDVNRAVEDGYNPPPPAEYCVPNMGIHYLSFNPLTGEGLDDSVKVGNPEILVYAETDEGLRLIGVEYFSTSEFSLFGQESEPGPFPGTHALHAWLFTDAPLGKYHHVSGDVDVDCEYIAS